MPASGPRASVYGRSLPKPTRPTRSRSPVVWAAFAATRVRTAVLEVARGETGYHPAWVRWSSTYGELSVLAAQIGRRPIGTDADLAIRFDALMWLLLDDGAVLDREAEPQIRLFGREGSRLAAS